MWREAAKLSELAPGGVKSKFLDGRDIAVCHCADDGALYAVSRRCGHMNAPLEQGCLEGWILTCPLHYAQFDIRSGRNLSLPFERDPGPDPWPPTIERYEAVEHRVEWKIRVYDLDTYPVRVSGDIIEVDV